MWPIVLFEVAVGAVLLAVWTAFAAISLAGSALHLAVHQGGQSCHRPTPS